MFAPVLALLLTLSPGGDGQVQGRVIDSRTAQPVVSAEVQLVGAGEIRTARTGLSGEYSFEELPAGDYRIHITHPGYEPADIRVVLSAERSLYVDVPLLLRPVEMTPIIARATRPAAPTRGDPAPEAHPPRSIANTFAHRLSPRGASPLADMVASTADARNLPEPGGKYGHVLYVWGSGTERGRVFVDGAALNAPLHMGGLLGALDAELMASADLRSGGSSPRYDGGATYIMDYVTRSAQAKGPRTVGEFDPIATRFVFESPVRQHGGILVGARRINSEIMTLLMDRPFGYGYADLLVRADGRLGPWGSLRATAIATRERIEVPRDQDVDDATWSNVAMSVGWRDRSGPTFYALHGSFSRGVADLPLLSAPNGHMTATVDRWSASAERHWAATEFGGVFGVEFERLDFHRVSGADYIPIEYGTSAPMSCTPALPCFGTTTASVAGYGELAWQPSSATSARAGVRIVHRPGSGVWDALPRISFTSMLGRHTSVTLSGGRYSQPFAALSIAGSDVQIAIQASGDIRAIAEVAYANQVELNVVRRTEPSALAATIFVRHHEAGGDGEERVIPGVDLTWSYALRGVTAAVGYSLAIDPAASDTSRYSLGRHLATASLVGEYGPMDLRVSGAFGYGIPFTSIVLEHTTGASAAIFTGERGSGADGDARASVTTSPDRPYFRLDAELSAQWTTERGGRIISVTPYARLVNALSHRDAMFYYYDRGLDAEPRPLARLAAVPVLGVRWEF